MQRVLKLLFIRHAQSVGNQEKRMQGHGEFELSNVGRQQAQKLAQSLLAEGWIPSHVYSSPLKRAAQTTQILLDHFRLAPLPGLEQELKTVPIEYTDELKEFQNGIFQGLTWAEATTQYPELCCKLESSPDWIPIPGAESLQDARDRARRFIHRLLEQHQDGSHVWVISHGWILQHLISELMGCDRSWRLRVQNTAIFEFWLDRSRWHCGDQNLFNTDLWQVRRFNDYYHLNR